jgi:uncharacterized membrane protein YdjX (TVP38/TMEM64 family)
MNTKNLKFIFPLLILIILVISAKYFVNLSLVLGWIKELGTLAAIAFILIYILSTILFIPGSILTLGSGALFGVIWGSVYVSIGSTLGGTLAFLVGRYLAREWVDHQLIANAQFQSVANAVSREGWKIVLLTRLSPLFPFNLLNYAFGVTQVSLKDYFFASWMGMLPGTIMYVYVGSLIGDIAKISTGINGRSRSVPELVLYGVGFIATVTVTIYVTKIAKKALENEIQD